MNKEPIVLYQNEVALKNDLTVIRHNVETVNAIKQQFEDLEIGSVENFKELKNLIENPESFCQARIKSIAKEPLVIAGMKVSQRKLLELAQPEGLSEFLTFVKSKKRLVYFGTDKWYSPFQGESDYEKISFPFIDEQNFTYENGSFEVKPSYVKSITDFYTVAIDTPERERAYNLLQETAAKINEVSSLLRSKDMPPIYIKQGILYTDEATGETKAGNPTLINLIRSTKN